MTVTRFLSAAIDDLCEVLEVVDDLNEWKRLGLKLGLYIYTLEKIEGDNDGIDNRKMMMLAAWLRQQDNVSQKGVPSWSVLQHAMKKMGKKITHKITVSWECNTVNMYVV